MALSIGVWSSSTLEGVELPCFRLLNNRNLLMRQKFLIPISRINDNYLRKQKAEIKCLASKESVTHALESEENVSATSSGFVEDDDLSHVMKFKMSDFKIHDRVSIGLCGRV